MLLAKSSLIVSRSRKFDIPYLAKIKTYIYSCHKPYLFKQFLSKNNGSFPYFMKQQSTPKMLGDLTGDRDPLIENYWFMALGKKSIKPSFHPDV